jgi:hypothetical protein
MRLGIRPVYAGAEPENGSPMNEESPQAGVNEKPDDNDADVQPWWRRSPLLAAGASAVIGAGTLWFGNMLGRVPLDQHATIGYLLMLPMLRRARREGCLKKRQWHSGADACPQDNALKRRRKTGGVDCKQTVIPGKKTAC